MKTSCVLFGMLFAVSALAGEYDVRDYGAKGDGKTKDTAAIQRAIDLASAAGGGTVRLGAGTFISGSLYLKSNVDFFLDDGATLKGSPDREDYNHVGVCPQNTASVFESASGAHLVLCIEQTNVTVRGTGRIDGNSGAFIIGPDGRNWPKGQSGVPWRTSQMLYFVESRSIRVEGISVIDSPYWSCFFHGCTDVVASNLVVRTRRELVHTHNGDGIDIDCCQDVLIADCDIDTADDSITLRANHARLKTKRPCERIRVERCRLSSACNAVRLGVGDGIVRDAVFRDIEIRDSRTAVNMVSSWRSGSKGVDFENIVFDGMKVDALQFCLIFPLYAMQAKVQGIRFKNVSGTVQTAGWVVGRRNSLVSDIAFENVDLPCPVAAINVERFDISGGTLKRMKLTDEELARYNEDIEKRNRFPGFLRIRGGLRGGVAFGGAVKTPVRGVCSVRGDTENFPGNSVAAVASAFRKGAAMIRLDVRRCRSGDFVIFQDDRIDELTTGTGKVEELTLAEIKSCRYKRVSGAGHRIATLDEVLDVIPDGGILLDLHAFGDSAMVCDLARKIAARGRLHHVSIYTDVDGVTAARLAVPGATVYDVPGGGFPFQCGGKTEYTLVSDRNAAYVREASIYDARGVSVGTDGIVCGEKGKAFDSCTFGVAKDWELGNYCNALKLSVGMHEGVAALVVDGSAKKTDTAWNARSRRFPVPHGIKRCLVSMDVHTDVELAQTLVPNAAVGGSRWSSVVFWYDASGREILVSPLPFYAPAGSSEVAVPVDVPPGAVSASVRLGFDVPNIGPGEKAVFSRLAFASLDGGEIRRSGSFVSEVHRGGRISWMEYLPHGTSIAFRYRGADTVKELFTLPFRGPDGTDKSSFTQPFDAKGKFVQYRAELFSDGLRSPKLASVTVGDVLDSRWTDCVDTQPPEIFRAMPSPTEETRFPLAFEVRDSSVVDWDTLVIRVDGEDATSRFVQDGNTLREKAPRDRPYSNGVHRAEIELADCRGNRVKSCKIFYVGRRPDTPRWSLRDDGMALVDGTPFFPIGIYGVCKREFNGMDFDVAFGEIKKAGFNMAHSYVASYDRDFLESAGKHGLKLWVASRLPGGNFMKKGRFAPEIAAWYLGDDTSMHQTPQQVRDSDDAVKAVDPTRLTTQADVVSSFAKVSEYQHYVTASDVFMPEIYPVYGMEGDAGDRTCVAATIHKMKRVRADADRYGDGRTRAIWPILQYFKGWGAWGSFPTKQQLFATSFAAIIHGGHGITWYTYGGFYDKRRKSRNEGVTSSPERWAAISELAGWMKELSLALTAPRSVQPPVPEVLSGPVHDPLGQSAVTSLFVRDGSVSYLLTVNAAPEPVRARMNFPDCDGSLEVMRENRVVSCRTGVFEDDFKPFGVHVYMFTR